MNNKFKPKTLFSLCCGSKNCPTFKQLDADSTKFTITDDYGGTVQLKKEEIVELVQKLKQYGLVNIS